VEPILAIALIAILLAPLHLMVMYQLDRMDSPAYLRRFGVIVLRLEALDSCAEVIGSYAGRAIYGAVTFKAMVYDFDRIATPGCKKRIGHDELYLDPGLIYVARDPVAASPR
jgi:hypothetical protein